MITKSRNTSDNWVVHTDATGTQTYSFLNTTDAFNTDSVPAPTSSVFYRGTSNTINGNNLPYVSYCWTEIEGYSKFGTYFANGNADGNFVYCGFKPTWLMIKPYGSGNGCYSGGYSSWSIYDSSRSPVNNTTMHERVLFANRFMKKENEDKVLPLVLSKILIYCQTDLNYEVILIVKLIRLLSMVSFLHLQNHHSRLRTPSK